MMRTMRELTAHDDFDEVGRVYVESWKASYRDILPQPYLNRHTPNRWSAMLRADPSASLGLFVDGCLAGMSMVGYSHDPDREGWGEVVSIYLLPEYASRGRGGAEGVRD